MVQSQLQTHARTLVLLVLSLITLTTLLCRRILWNDILSFLNELNVITEQRLNSLFGEVLVLRSYFFGYQSNKNANWFDGKKRGSDKSCSMLKVPPLCRQYYLDKKASDQTSRSAKSTQHRILKRHIIDEHTPALPNAGQKRKRDSDPSNTRCLTAPSNMPNGQLQTTTVRNVAATSAMNMVRFLATSGLRSLTACYWI